MKLIPLTQGRFAMVDDWNYEQLNKFKWCVFRHKKTLYALTHIKISDKFKTILMHRYIMGTPTGEEVDHIDHNGLNCQESNMRNCSHKQNMRNVRSHGQSKYKGVTFQQQKRLNGKIDTYIKASIYKDKTIYRLGLFKSEEAAAMAYDKKAVELFGEFAFLNFK